MALTANVCMQVSNKIIYGLSILFTAQRFHLTLYMRTQQPQINWTCLQAATQKLLTREEAEHLNSQLQSRMDGNQDGSFMYVPAHQLEPS